MKLINRIPSFLRNKFFLAGAGFLVWMLFFDKNDIYTQYERKSQLTQLQRTKQYYTEQIATERHISEELKSNPATIEKYAREKYLMKRDNEDIFIIQPSEKK